MGAYFPPLKLLKVLLRTFQIELAFLGKLVGVFLPEIRWQAPLCISFKFMSLTTLEVATDTCTKTPMSACPLMPCWRNYSSATRTKIRRFVDNFDNNLIDIIGSKAPGNYSASFWFNNFSILLLRT